MLWSVFDRKMHQFSSAADQPSRRRAGLRQQQLEALGWKFHRIWSTDWFLRREEEDLLAHRGITVSYESIRHWCETFGLAYARRLRQRAGPVGDTWHLDELFVTIRGQRQYLWAGRRPRR